MPNKPIVISLDGNIGAGKSTLLEALRNAMPDVEVVLEPVGLWSSLKDADGKSLLELFYEDKRRWAYTFQNFALLSRAKALAEAMAQTKKVRDNYGAFASDGSLRVRRNAALLR